MTVKNISTRAKICGRSAKCTGGHSAVEQSSYISREKMYCEYDGQTYYPKYSEDLVHCEVLLPENAPKEYKDPYVLWNSVELVEKSKDAQLARTFRIELPNEWSYDLAKEVVKDYCERNFVSKGMCVQYAIHDSENKQGQRNLHCHIMLTLRSLDEQGNWMPKQRKVYQRDENGERIPDIDKKTGQQKVDKQNRKQWKCSTIQTNDWNSRENAKIWRKDLADTINAVNAKIGMTDKFWEYRSFKEQGLDIIPQIHLGEKASAMERAGIRTIRGDINREIIAKNAVINAARVAYERAKEELTEVMAIPVTVAKAFKSEIIDVIRKMAERNNNRLTLPIMKGKFIGAVSDRASLQDKAKM
ncbi:MAG: MobA/MobL family protein, partial [Oscillospiraceae bacterium]|nr:MobA/MobL family protein [Oscillospiraceae bacterium]